MTRERSDVLVWASKHEDQYYGPIVTEDDELEAYLQVFNTLNDWGAYMDIDAEAERDEYTTLEDWTFHRQLHAAALKGDAHAARTLISMRQDYEYESVYIHPLRNVGTIAV